jgi:hypothetical protein
MHLKRPLLTRIAGREGGEAGRERREEKEEKRTKGQTNDFDHWWRMAPAGQSKGDSCMYMNMTHGTIYRAKKRLHDLVLHMQSF